MVGATLGNCFLFGPYTAVRDIVDDSTSQVQNAFSDLCGKVRREDLSLIWGRRDGLGGRVSFIA